MSRRELALLGAITVAAAIVRFATLDLQSYHHDEAVTAARVLLPNLGDTLDVVVDSERSPPLYYVVAWAWAKLFGTGEAGLRSLSALAGTLAVPAAFFAARELAGRSIAAVRIGLVAAAFVAFNPHLVWYSQEARAYALLVLFTALALALFARAERDPTPLNLALWAGASAAAFLSHYFAIFPAAAEALWLVWALGRERRRALGAAIAVAAVGLALLPLALSQEGADRRNAFTEIPVAHRAEEVALDYAAGEEPDPLAGETAVDAVQLSAVIAGVALLALAIWLVARHGSREERHGAFLAAVVAAGAVAVPTALAFAGLDYLNPRNLVAGTIPLACIGALGFGAERAWRLGRVATAATCVLFAGVVLAADTSHQMQRTDWRGAAAAMGSATATRLVVTNANGDDPLAYYLAAEKFEGRRYDGGARVSELRTVSTTFEVTAPPGFRLVSQEGYEGLILRTYESDRPQRLDPSDVGGERVLAGEPSAALIQSP